MKLTVTVITLNEAANIGAALASAAWADEIIVLDAGSTDGTAAIARQHATRVEVVEWPGYGAQKNRAADLASNDWILSLDADERITPELAAEIREVLGNPASAGYRIPRVTWYLGRWIRSTDWYPDLQLRLYDRRVARWNLRPVHESVDLRGTPGRLRNEIQHYAYRNVSHHLRTIEKYTTLAADRWAAEGRETTALSAAVHANLAFLRNYVLRGGIRDGSAGLLVSVLNSYYVFLKHAKLWERQRRRPAAGPTSNVARPTNVPAPTNAAPSTGAEHRTTRP